MADNEPTLTPDATLVTPAQAAVTTGASQASGPENDEYKRRFNGLQPLYQKAKEEAERLKAEKFDLEAKLQAALGEKEALTLTQKSLNEKNATLAAEREAAKSKAERLALLATDFRDLLDFEKDGLLPEGTGEVLTAKLTSFREALGKRGKEAVTQAASGATPPAPSPGAPATPRDHLKLAQDAQNKGDMVAYTQHYNNYLAALNKKAN